MMIRLLFCTCLSPCVSFLGSIEALPEFRSENPGPAQKFSYSRRSRTGRHINLRVLKDDDNDPRSLYEKELTPGITFCRNIDDISVDRTLTTGAGPNGKATRNGAALHLMYSLLLMLCLCEVRRPGAATDDGQIACNSLHHPDESTSSQYDLRISVSADNYGIT